MKLVCYQDKTMQDLWVWSCVLDEYYEEKRVVRFSTEPAKLMSFSQFAALVNDAVKMCDVVLYVQGLEIIVDSITEEV